MPITCLCTIVAKNYIASARTLCRSWQEYHPGSTCYVLIVDDFAEWIDLEEEPFAVLALRDLVNLPNPRQMCFKYSIVELCTAVKPFLMEHILEHYLIDRLVYLDPDILVTDSLAPILDRLDQVGSDILITPHLDEGAAIEEIEDMDSHLMQHGIFNLGFLAVSNRPPALKFLTWFKGKLLDKCVVNHRAGFFVDQKFIDYALGIFPNFLIVRDVGCNVARWNAPTRHLSKVGNTWKCNGEPLRFFHFSNLKPEGRMPTEHEEYVRRPDIQPLWEIYRQKVIANGYGETRLWPYTYSFFDGGTKVPSNLRRFYGNALRGGMKGIDNPFSSRILKSLAFHARAEGWLRARLDSVGRHLDQSFVRRLRRRRNHPTARSE